MMDSDGGGENSKSTSVVIEHAVFAAVRDKAQPIKSIFSTLGGGDINQPNPDGQTLLHVAVSLEREDVVIELLKRGAKLDIEDNQGFFPLDYAVENDDLGMAKVLIEGFKSNYKKSQNELAGDLSRFINRTGPDGKSAGGVLLASLITRGQLEEAKDLVAMSPTLAVVQDSNKKTLLHHAIEKGNNKLAQELFNLNSDAAVLQNKDGKTPIHIALEQGDIALVNSFIELNPKVENLNIQDNQGVTLLNIATRISNDALVLSLLSKGADPSIADVNNKTPLHHAAEAGNLTLANTLIQGYKALQGQDQSALADFIIQPSGDQKDGPSAGELLIEAYSKKNAKGEAQPDFKAMIELLEIAPELATNREVQKVLKETVDADGKNILHYLDSAIPIPKHIVEAVPELATKLDTKNGKSPLHYAAEKEDVALVGALGNNDRKRAVAHLDTNGNNLLHIAAAKGNKKMVEKFIKVADVASLGALNSNNQTPRQVAKGELADLLYQQEQKLAIEAAKSGNVADLKILLKNNENLLNAQDEYGNTLLHHAAMAGKSEIVNTLLDRGADITSSNEKGQSARAVVGGEEATKCANAIGAKEKEAIFAAVEKGDKDLVKKLLEQNPGLVQEKDDQNRTLLHIAAEKGHAEILQAVINVIPESDKNNLINAKDLTGQTSLHYASENLHEASKKMLIDKGAKIDTPNGSNKTAEDLGKQALLLKQVREGKLEEVQAFLNKKDNREFIIGAKDKDSKSILHIAAEMGHTEIAQAIIKSNPELAEQIDKKGRTPYHYSAAEGHNDISNALVNTKGTDTADAEIREARKAYENIPDENGKTANDLFKEFQVIKAVKEGKIEELSERLNENKDLINAKDKDGKNLLHIAIESNQMEMMKELVKRYPELMEQKDKSEKTPIETALEKSDEHAFHQVMEQVKPEDRKLLLDGDLGKDNGLYHKALAQGKLEHAEIMLASLDKKEDRLAIVGIPDKEKRNLLHLAAEKGNDQVVANVLDLVKDIKGEELVALLTARDENRDTPLHSAAKAGNRDIFEEFVEKVGDREAAVKGIDLVELDNILQAAEKKKLREMEEKLEKEKAAQNAKSASAQNSAQQAASSPSQSNEQKGAAHSKEDFLNGAIDSVKFTPCTGEEKKFNSNNQRAMSDQSKTHLMETRNEDGSFSYELKKVEPNSPTKLHKIDGQFGELIFNGAGEMIGAKIKDPSKLHLLGKEQREQALKLNEEKDQGMAKSSSSLDALDQPPAQQQQQQAKIQATPASILSAPAVAANTSPRPRSDNIPSSYPSEQQQVQGQRQGGQSDGRGREAEFDAGFFSESDLEAARVALARGAPAGPVLARRAPAGPALAHRAGGTKATPVVPAAASWKNRVPGNGAVSAAALRPNLSRSPGGATPVEGRPGGTAVDMRKGDVRNL